MSATETKRKTADEADSDYDSADDADFQDDDALSNSESDESDVPKLRKKNDKDLDSGDELTIAKQKKKRKDVETDDLILTRAQKRAKYIRQPFSELKP